MTPMVLYLCQHGDALGKDVDPDRPLSERGVTDVCNMANALRGSIETAEIVHSGKTRSRQTAELLHERLAPDAAIRAGEGLAPNDSVEAFAEKLAPRDAPPGICPSSAAWLPFSSASITSSWCFSPAPSRRCTGTRREYGPSHGC